MALTQERPPKNSVHNGELAVGESSRTNAKNMDRHEDSSHHYTADQRSVLKPWKIFYFATKLDLLLMIIGTVAAVVHGAALPTFIWQFGKANKVFANEYISRDIARSLNLSTSPVECGVLTQTCLLPENIDTSQCYILINDSRVECTSKSDLLEELDKPDGPILFFCWLGLTVLVTGWLHVSLFQVACERQVNVIRKRFFRAILSQDISWFDANGTGELNSRMNDDLQKIHSGIGDKLSLFIQWTTSFIAGIVVSLIIKWELTLLMIGCTPFLVFGTAYIQQTVAKFSSVEQEEYANAGAVAEEVISSIHTVLAFGGQDKELSRYNRCLNNARKTGVKKGISTGMGLALTSFLIFGIEGVGFWFSGWLIQNRDSEINEVLTAFFATLFGAFSLGQAAPNLQDFTTATGAAGFIFNTIFRASRKIAAQPSVSLKPNKIRTEIAFEDIHFHYPTRPDVQVLKGLSLKVSPGQTLALVGPSGCGKSTITQLLQRFYDPDQGKVTFGGYDICELNLHWLRSNIGVVSQEPVLFATTIAENIHYGRDDVTEEEMIAAAEAANAHSFISELPDGYNTLVGEMGTQLSGGQKQRIAIARAIVRDPKILILDEATSALDAESESLVQAALDQASHGRTTIIIAHRLSTIQRADVIAAIVNGRVMESGTHAELLARKGVYYNLVSTQACKSSDNEVTNTVMCQSEMKKVHSQHKRKSSIRRSIKLLPSQYFRRSSALSLQSAESAYTVDQEVDEDDQTLPDAPLWRVIKASSPEWYLIIIGILASSFEGAAFPITGILVGKFYEIFADPRNAEENSRLFAGLFGIVAVASGMAAFFRTLCFTVAGHSLTSRLRNQSFKAILKQDIGWFDLEENSTGALTGQLSHDASQVQGATGSRFGAVSEMVVGLTTGLVIAFVYGWLVTILILLTLPLLLGALVIQSRLLMGVTGTKKNDEAENIAYESISNIRTVVSLGLEVKFCKKFEQCIQSPYQKALRTAYVLGLGNGLADSLACFLNAMVYRFGAFLIAINEDHFLHMEFGDLGVVFVALFFGVLSAGKASTYAPNYAKARLSAKRIFSLIDGIDNFSEEPGEKPKNTSGCISLNNVKFKYPARPDIQVLQGLSLSVKSGQTLALVGPSGCGKSTVVSLLERFHDPERGNVKLDGVNIKDLNIQWLRYQMGLVSQEPTLFDCSIADNIRYGDNFREVTYEEVEEAAKSANIHDFVTSLPQGYSTNVGSRGTQLSGGQKQRIAIARALVRKPKILLLDEATSALDTENEKVVQEALDKAREGRTSVVIAHRLSTVHNADLIVVIKDGKAIEAGTHSELMSQKGVYYKLNETLMKT